MTGTAKPGQPKKIAILGGGPAGVAAAFWLSDPLLAGRYEISLYSQGWRLGGKCASGRNAELGERIEEHGLHILMGCYQNAFATLRQCYEEWRAGKPDPDNALQSWKDGFKPQRLVSLMDSPRGGDWDAWNIPFPKLDGEPGDEVLAANANPALRSISPDGHLILALMDTVTKAIPDDALFKKAVETWFAVVRYKIIPAGLQPSVGEKVALADAQLAIGNYLDSTVSSHASLNGAVEAVGIVDTLRMIAIGGDLAIAMTAGYLADLLGKGDEGYDAINDLDMREWLGKHGATHTTRNSGLVNAIYDLAFAQVGGMQDSPGSLAAGASFRAQLELSVGYNNAPLWRMMAGTADTVFTPFYDVLVARGVDIKLFHRVVGLSSANGELSQIKVRQQARTIGDKPYQPLRRIALPNGKQLDSWPNQPNWDQLVNGETLKSEGIDFEYSDCLVYSDPARTLVAGDDFDIAICAMPPLALRPLFGDLMTSLPQFAEALDASSSVATQAMQLWMDKDLAELGWSHGSTVLTSFAGPYDSWGDMSELLDFECWNEVQDPTSRVPHSLGYFCGTMGIAGRPQSPPNMKDLASDVANKWVNTSLASLWPSINDASLETLPFSSYVRANFDQSEQYVQTPAGNNVAARLDPGSPSELSNCYFIGDWTKTRFSGGCFESAIESGMLAARSIGGFPRYVKTA